jgi:hypothetical protein
MDISLYIYLKYNKPINAFINKEKAFEWKEMFGGEVEEVELEDMDDLLIVIKDKIKEKEHKDCTIHTYDSLSLTKYPYYKGYFIGRAIPKYESEIYAWDAPRVRNPDAGRLYYAHNYDIFTTKLPLDIEEFNKKENEVKPHGIYYREIDGEYFNHILNIDEPFTTENNIKALSLKSNTDLNSIKFVLNALKINYPLPRYQHENAI